MATVIIVIHLMVVVAMIGLVLLQRSEGGALGIGGGSGAFMSGRGAANVLTRSTGILAAVFFATSVSLALLSRLEAGPTDIFSDLPGTASAPAPAETPVAPPVSSGSGSASDMLKQLGGTSSGPQTPPAADGGSANSGAADGAASANDLAAPMGDTMAPATGESTAPAAGDAGTTAPADGSGPQAPPASGSQ